MFRSMDTISFNGSRWGRFGRPWGMEFGAGKPPMALVALLGVWLCALALESLAVLALHS
jgi:hypothetical protein